MLKWVFFLTKMEELQSEMKLNTQEGGELICYLILTRLPYHFTIVSQTMKTTSLQN